MASKNTICLWYDNDALDAATFYAQTFPDSAVGAVHRAPGDYPAGQQGNILMVEFTVMGIPCLGLNGGPGVQHNEAFSFQVATNDQAETDRLWNAIVGNGGQEKECGWCRDRWGLSWQITPRVLMDAVTGTDPAAAKRAFDAMLTMKKIDVAAIEAARRGGRRAAPRFRCRPVRAGCQGSRQRRRRRRARPPRPTRSGGARTARAGTSAWPTSCACPCPRP
jgi:2-polyprenyl-6-hydroxyphenyl methylase/3-demethylubiquinone-9 3-methyltransferase